MNAHAVQARCAMPQGQDGRDARADSCHEKGDVECRFPTVREGGRRGGCLAKTLHPNIQSNSFTMRTMFYCAWGVYVKETT